MQKPDTRFQTERSSGYRMQFLAAHPQQWFVCRYCGKLAHRQHITVDHVVPVHGAQVSIIARMLLKAKGIRDVNDTENLVPACARCNRRKSAKVQIGYLVLAKIGGHPAYWILKWCLDGAILGISISLAAVALCEAAGVLF